MSIALPSKEDLQANVEAGADLLDEEFPGWEHDIDLARLNLSDAFNCVLGQLFGCVAEYEESYFTGCDFLVGDGDPSEYGFNADSDRTYAYINKMWAQEILERRNEPR